MNNTQIKALVEKGLFMGKPERAVLLETHISWVVLAGDYAYKIKKPLQLSFLDFRKLSDRKKYCEEELRLNQRFSKQLYRDVLPIVKNENTFQIGGKGTAVDYAVRMKRLDEKKLMSLQLKKNKVSPAFISTLAGMVSRFHQAQEPILKKYDPYFLSREFADISGMSGKAKKILGAKWYKEIQECIKRSNAFVAAHEVFIRFRADSGNIRDVHGDLHTQNIFVYEKPVLFDCVEFKKEFRQIDLLNEVAFLCMDLEAMKRSDLSELFFATYLKKMKLSRKDPELMDLFTYFKAYRACIRAKVAAIELVQHPEDKKIAEKVKLYTKLMRQYLEDVEV